MEKYNQILKMLNASSLEDRKLGLAIVESLNFEKNSAMVLCLYKHDPRHAEWPSKITSRLPDIIADKRTGFFDRIHSYLLKKQAGKEEMQLFSDIVSQRLLEVVREAGFTLIDKLEVTLSPIPLYDI